MGILALIVFAIAIAAMVVVFLVKRGKEDELETKPSVEPEKPKEKPKEPVQEPVVNYEPKFKVGQTITDPDDPTFTFHINKIEDGKYIESYNAWVLIADADKEYQLVEEPEIPKEEPEKDNTEEMVDNILRGFEEFVKVEKDSSTYNYLKELYKEAESQYYKGESCHGLPLLYKDECFPQIYNFYGEDGDEERTFYTLVGWLFAMQLAELKPQDRTSIYKIGYELGGYDKDTALYGWKFKCDLNIARMVAAAIYAAMRGVCKPDIETMREEVDGENHYGTIAEAREYNSFEVGEEDFFVDLREFMPTAPGPYAPDYKDRSAIGGYPYPNDAKMDDYNLVIDRAIRDMVVEKYNLSLPLVYNGNMEETMEQAYQNTVYSDATVQAIADKDANYNHLFGKERQVENYHFNPVFTSEALGQEVYPSLAKELCSLVDDVLHIGSYQRCILQGNEGQMNPPQYGRLRPGCSWNMEAHRHSDSDDTQNVVVDFYIEDNDGNPTGYYNQDGEWVNKDGIHSPEEYNDVMKDELWANSYPSGHSAGISSCCWLLIELLPMQADKILAAANRFAVNRTIARYHWNSDTIQGRVLATCIAPIIRCCSDWKERFKKAKECLK